MSPHIPSQETTTIRSPGTKDALTNYSDRLDDDDLYQIFLAGALDEADIIRSYAGPPIFTFPETVAQIDRRWRSIALASPLIWARIWLGPQCTKERLHRWISLSGQVTLDLIWFIRHTSMQTCMQFLNHRNLSRLQHLTIILTYRGNPIYRKERGDPILTQARAKWEDSMRACHTCRLRSVRIHERRSTDGFVTTLPWHAAEMLFRKPEVFTKLDHLELDGDGALSVEVLLRLKFPPLAVSRKNLEALVFHPAVSQPVIKRPAHSIRHFILGPGPLPTYPTASAIAIVSQTVETMVIWGNAGDPAWLPEADEAYLIRSGRADNSGHSVYTPWPRGMKQWSRWLNGARKRPTATPFCVSLRTCR